MVDVEKKENGLTLVIFLFFVLLFIFACVFLCIGGYYIYRKAHPMYTGSVMEYTFHSPLGYTALFGMLCGVLFIVLFIVRWKNGRGRVEE